MLELAKKLASGVGIQKALNTLLIIVWIFAVPKYCSSWRETVQEAVFKEMASDNQALLVELEFSFIQVGCTS